MKISVRKTAEYATSTIALLIVATAVVGAIIYAIKHRTTTIEDLSTGVVQGVGVAIGGLIGSALVLRFEAARTFIRNLLKDIK